MSDEKKFGASLFGFNKSDVNAYIEKTYMSLTFV